MAADLGHDVLSGLTAAPLVYGEPDGGRLMAQVYLVTHGAYSDYHVEAAFDNEVNAEMFRSAFGYDQVEPIELNPDVPQIREGMKHYRVWMRKDGSVVGKVQLSDNEFNYIHYESFSGELVLIYSVWARDEQHAIKITNDVRAALIAEGGFVPGPSKHPLLKEKDDVAKTA